MKHMLLLIVLLAVSCNTSSPTGLEDDTTRENSDIPALTEDFVENVHNLNGTLYNYTSDYSSPAAIDDKGKITYKDILDRDLLFVRQLSPTKAIYREPRSYSDPDGQNRFYYYRYKGVSIVDDEIWIYDTVYNSDLGQLENNPQWSPELKAQTAAKAYAEKHIDWNDIPTGRFFYIKDNTLGESNSQKAEFLNKNQGSYINGNVDAVLKKDGTLTFTERGTGSSSTYKIVGTRSLNTAGNGKEAYFVELPRPGDADEAYTYHILVGIYNNYIYTFPASSFTPGRPIYNKEPRTLEKYLEPMLYK